MNNKSEIICPACRMKNEPGAFICIHCNTALGHNNQKTVMLSKRSEHTNTLPDDFDKVLGAPRHKSERFMDFEIPSNGIVLIQLENGQPIAILNEKSFILGRESDEIKIWEPLVDLTHLNAYEYGISRVHARIRKVKNSYQIIDLESTNGTWIENQRIAPKTPTPLASGDRIRLGRLNMLVFYMG